MADARVTIILPPALLPAQPFKPMLPRAAGGEKSLAVIAALDPELHAALPPQVVNAILYHDGLYGENADQVYGNETPLLIIMHFADMMSSRLARPPKAVEPE